MSGAARIERVHGREVLDSRGRPTVEVEVRLASGALGRAIAPSGASTGRHEAVELRDGDHSRFGGRGVLVAVANVNTVLADALMGFDALDQAGADALLVDLDGTSNCSMLGANALLPASIAISRAAAAEVNEPLWRYLGSGAGTMLPLPMVNVISGGLHADHAVDCQDFLVLPVGASSYSLALVAVAQVLEATARLLSDRGYSTFNPDEGGFGPRLRSNEEALDLLVEAIEEAGLIPGEDVAIGVDVAATHFYDAGRDAYVLAREDKVLDKSELIDRLEGWLERYPIVSLEDGLAEDDWEGWVELTDRVGRRAQLVGDDLFVTNAARLTEGVSRGAANAVLIKPNQIGTLSETLAVLDQARASGYATIVSARSGETEDPFIADLAVATNAGQIKIGSLAQSERLAKYNQLLRIEEALGENAVFVGAGALAGTRPA